MSSFCLKELSAFAKRPGVKLLAFLFLFIFLTPTQAKEKPVYPSVKISEDDGHFRMTVEGELFFIKGVCYSPVPIGQGHSFDIWDQDIEVFRADAKMLKELGANVIRIYQPGTDVEKAKKAIRVFYDEFGIRTIIGHWLGFWQGSAPAYPDPEFRKNVKQDALKMVRAFKDEPGVLMWVLGNENNFSFGKESFRVWSSPEFDAVKDPILQRQKKAKLYFSFVNEVAQAIKRVDRARPVALGNGGLDHIEIAAQVCPHVDILASSIYNGRSFSSAFRKVKQSWGKPFFISEFGSDSFDAVKKVPDQQIQEKFIVSQWKEIERNKAGSESGNCLGGIVFEFNDEWWKVREYDQPGWSVQDEDATWSNGAYYFDIQAESNLNMNEEWWGIVSLSPDKPFDKRTPKKSYFGLKDCWQTPVSK